MLEEHVTNDAALRNRLIELSRDGQAWVGVVRPFSHQVQFYAFASPSKVPDSMYRICRGEIGWKGEVRGFTKSAIIREQNRGLSCQ